MWWEYPNPIDPTLIAGDIMREFNCTPKEATLFLRAYGFKMGRRNAISLRQLRRLQMDGTAAEFFSKAGKDRK